MARLGTEVPADQHIGFILARTLSLAQNPSAGTLYMCLA